jgi:adenosylcobinamide amidohydrolase
VAAESARGLTALVVATVGLGNVVGAGRSPVAPATPGTINTIAIVDADVEPAALVNLALTVTEVKTLVLVAAGLPCADGGPASGTSTDAVVVAATGRGPVVRFGGPISDAGWVVGRAARAALGDGVQRWLRDRQ